MRTILCWLVISESSWARRSWRDNIANFLIFSLLSTKFSASRCKLYREERWPRCPSPLLNFNLRTFLPVIFWAGLPGFFDDDIFLTRRLKREKIAMSSARSLPKWKYLYGRYTVCINNERRRTRHVSGTLCGIVESSVCAYPSNDSHISATCICGLQYLLQCTRVPANALPAIDR